MINLLKNVLITFYRSLDDYQKQLAELKVLLVEVLWQHRNGYASLSESTIRNVFHEIEVHEYRVRMIELAERLGFVEQMKATEYIEHQSI